MLVLLAVEEGDQWPDKYGDNSNLHIFETKSQEKIFPIPEESFSWRLGIPIEYEL